MHVFIWGDNVYTYNLDLSVLAVIEDLFFKVDYTMTYWTCSALLTFPTMSLQTLTMNIGYYDQDLYILIIWCHVVVHLNGIPCLVHVRITFPDVPCFCKSHFVHILLLLDGILQPLAGLCTLHYLSASPGLQDYAQWLYNSITFKIPHVIVEDEIYVTLNIHPTWIVSVIV